MEGRLIQTSDLAVTLYLIGSVPISVHLLVTLKNPYKSYDHSRDTAILRIVYRGMVGRKDRWTSHKHGA